jgi:hypothetical protein
MTDRVNEIVERLRWQACSIPWCGDAADMLVELLEELALAHNVWAELVALVHCTSSDGSVELERVRALLEENERLSALLREQWEADSALYNAPHDVDSLVYAAMLERHDRSHAAIDAAMEPRK